MVSLNRIYCPKLLTFRAIFNGFCVLALFFLISHQEEMLQGLFSKKPFSTLPLKTIFDDGVSEYAIQVEVFQRKMVENSVNSSNYIVEKESLGFETNALRANRSPSICSGIHEHRGYSTECEYLKANPQCNSGGFFNYIKFFYCDWEKYKALRYLVLVIWLVTLFYLLGNTAADYFCCCLEKLSNLLQLSPTVAGVTLLPLGNGAPDVFASIAAFSGNNSGDVGLNGVLGGAVFVTCVVVGTVCLCIGGQSVQIDKKCFIRDMCFFLFALVSLLVILVVGKVNIGGAIAFVSIYVVYVFCVAANELLRKRTTRSKLESAQLLLPVSGCVISSGNVEDQSIDASLLQSDSQEFKLAHWMWASNVAVYSNEGVNASSEVNPASLWGWNEEDTVDDNSSLSCSKLCSLLELPLTLPRRLTIPIVEDERWSKTYAVASASFAPVLFAFLWNTQDNLGYLANGITYLIGIVAGGIFGVLAFIYTRADHPPRRFLLPWVMGGFVMSIIWFYMIANELVALLMAFGVIFGIKPSLLALTVLAWGNSMGDLMSNVAIAMNGGDGVQIAISGCFAGPMFNTLIGLGLSLVVGAWSSKPVSYIIPRDISLFCTLGFLVSGLVWSLIVLPLSNMYPNKLLGVGLMIIYLSFLVCRASLAMGDGSLHGSSWLL
ncbi:cation calcium exchanger 4 [Olea europaea subsp. europaea]|uniref:Cation calcium exchanger 4 n=1 Tax=Olea europaea subsp. europaea TaxID=158383 RepID=A0A8S0TU15_OLEEU|nr:cation calcium exchanger 4 [Olea europaea subsp. europaea]